MSSQTPVAFVFLRNTNSDTSDELRVLSDHSNDGENFKLQKGTEHKRKTTHGPLV